MNRRSARRPILTAFVLVAAATAHGQTFTWQNNANGQLRAQCEDPDFDYFWPDNDNWSQDQEIGPSPCTGDPGFLREPSNWDTPNYPDSPTATVVLTGGGSTILDVDAAVGTLQVDAGNTLDFGFSSNLDLHGGSIVNNGIIRMQNTFSTSHLRIHTDTTLSGSGVVRMTTAFNNRIDSSDPSHVLTIGPSQTIEATVPTGILTPGTAILLPFTNHGIISANQGDLGIRPAFGETAAVRTNHGTIRAIDGGELIIGNDDGLTIENASGILSADATSSITLRKVTINGGQLLGPGTIIVSNRDATFNGPVTLGNSPTVALDSGTKLTTTGALTNNGTITLGGIGASKAEFRHDGDLTIDGNGRILFGTDSNTFVNIVGPTTATDLLTLGSEQEIATAQGDFSGSIESALVNNGIITGNQGTVTLSLNDKTNNNLIRTLNGGTVAIAGITLDNSNGVIDLDEGGTLSLNSGCTLRGGSITGSGTITRIGGIATLDGVGLTIGPDITFTVSRGTNLVGTITNNGTFRLSSTLRTASDVTIDGSGKIIFDSASQAYIGDTTSPDTLTIGPNQTVTTGPDSTTNNNGFRSKAIIDGVVEARIGSLRLRTGAKTNNGTFRAVNGGELEMEDTDELLTNYDHASGTLSGGCYEVTDDGSGTLMDFQGATITTLAPNTKVVLSGPNASFPALDLSTVGGTLAIQNGQVLRTSGNVSVSGRLEFGLNGDPDSTCLDVDGDIDLSGAEIDIADFGATVGSYEVIRWTGARTGDPPTLANLSSGFAASLRSAGSAFVLDITAVPLPDLLGIHYDPETHTTTLTYQSVPGLVFGVLGGGDLKRFDPLPDTEVGNGAIMEYQHNLTGAPEAYFYKLMRR